MTDIALLRRELHSAIDDVLDRFHDVTGEHMTTASNDSAVVPGELFDSWSYTWPDGMVERYTGGRFYEVRSSRGTAHVRLAWTTRRAWGRMRRRAIVFLQAAGPNSGGDYPLTEFVETDDDRFAATIPNPERPRAPFRDGQPLPNRFSKASVERSDAVFTSIENGPSLRLVLMESDDVGMVEHGFWVAGLRRRL